MISLYRDPLGEKVFSKSGMTNQSPNRSVASASKGQPEVADHTIASLQNRVKNLECALSKHENIGTEIIDEESMIGNMKTSKAVSFRNEQAEEPLPSNGSYHN